MRIVAPFVMSVALCAQDAPRPGVGLPNRWYTEGGSPSRSGAVATVPLELEPERAWQFDAAGPIVGEPRVWDDYVVIECKLGQRKRRLQAVDLGTGTAIAHKDFFARSGLPPLAPTLWNRQVIVRAGGKLKRLRVDSAAITEQRDSEAITGLGPPLRVGNEVYATAGGRVIRFDAVRLQSVWQSAGGGFAGPVTLSEDQVFAMGFGQSTASIVGFDRERGQRRQSVKLPVPNVGRGGRIVVTDDLLIAHGLGAILLQGGDAVDALSYRLPLSGGKEPSALSHIPNAPAVADGHWVGGCGSVKKPYLGRGVAGEQQFSVLATPDAHPELLGAPVTIAGSLAYLGGVAVDLETLEVRWRIDVPKGARAIPARDSLLFVTESRVRAFRRQGAVLDVDVRARERTWAGAFVAAQHEALQDIVADAMIARAIDLLPDLFERCRAAGVEEKWVAQRERKTKGLARGRRGATEKEVAALTERRDGVATAAVAKLWRKLGVADLEGEERLRALRFICDIDSSYPPFATAVRELLPKELRPADETRDFDAAEWLAFLESTRWIDIDFLAVPTKEQIGTATPDQRKLLELRDRWRQDLIGVQSGRLLVYTPIAAPGSLARCLSLGELVCDTLEGMFEDRQVVRADARRMRILLFPTQEEYQEQSPGGGHLAWTAGHYSPEEQLSRMYLPDDRQAFARVMPVFVHELTHQWLQDRCPAISSMRSMRRDPRVPGYWLVEGFASFVEEFVFDLDRRTHATDSPRDTNLDILAHASDRMLVPWRTLVRASQVDFHRISPKPSFRVKLGHRLGVQRSLSPRNMFYAQAGGLCHWLWHAENGAHRDALIDLVIAYYHNERDAVDVTERIDRDAKVIGAAVVEHSKWR